MNATKLIFSLLIATNFHSSRALNIQEALKNGMVKVSMTSNGKPLADGMLTASIKNNSLSKLELKLPVGTKLVSEDDSRQNLILVQEEVLALNPNQSKQLDLKGMCIQASNMSPGDGINYSFGEVIRGDILECAQMIHQKKVINHCGQSAIWSFSDNYDVGWIDAENEAEKALRQFVADKKGVQNPWFTTAHSGGNNQLSRSYNPMQPNSDYYDMSGAEIKGDFQWTQNGRKKLTFAVYDQDGRLMRKFFENKEFDKGTFTFKFFYKTSKNLRGTYYAKMTSGSELIEQASFTF